MKNQAHIDRKTFEVMAIGIKGILNVAKSIDSSELFNNVSKEIELILDSVEITSTKKEGFENNDIKNYSKQVKVVDCSNRSATKEVTPAKIVKPLI